MKGDFVKYTPNQFVDAFYNSGARMLVLKDFNYANYQEIFICEALAYEIWNSMAALRSTGKGAILHVAPESPWYGTVRSPQLDQLIRSYDSRIGRFDKTAVGVVLQNPKDGAGSVASMQLNAAGEPVGREMNIYLRRLGVAVEAGKAGNFRMGVFNIREYYESHAAFAIPFKQKFGIEFSSYVTFVCTILDRRMLDRMFSLQAVFQDYAHGYEGPLTKDKLLADIEIKSRISALRLGTRPLGMKEIIKCFSIVTLDGSIRNSIHVGLGGPEALMYPLPEETLLLDYVGAPTPVSPFLSPETG